VTPGTFAGDGEAEAYAYDTTLFAPPRENFVNTRGL
jgi:hypothetical protein